MADIGKFLKQFYLLAIYMDLVSGLSVLVSNPFDPFRLECTNKNSITKIQIQRVESVGGFRTDNMITVFCESLAKTFPSERDQTSQPFEEKCHWSAPIFLPAVEDEKPSCGKREYIAGVSRESLNQFSFLCCMVTDRKRGSCESLSIDLPTPENPLITINRAPNLISGIGVRKDKLIVEFCTFDVLTQKEIDDQFIAAAKDKLDKWFAEQKKNQTTLLKAKGKSIPEEIEAKSEEVDAGANKPADFRSHNQILPVIKSAGQQLTSKGASKVGPPGRLPNEAEAAKFGIILTTKKPVKPSITTRPTKTVTVSPAKSTPSRQQIIAQDRRQPIEKLTTPTTKSTSTKKTTTAKPSTVKSTTKTTKLTTVTKSSTFSRVTSRSTQTKILPTFKVIKAHVTAEPTTIADPILENIGSLSESIDATEEKADSSPIAEKSFPRLPLHKEDLERFNSLNPKTTNFSANGKSDLPLSKGNPLPPPPDADGDVVYVDRDSLKQKPDSDSNSNSDSSTNSDSDSTFDETATKSNEIEYYYYYEDGRPASAKPAVKLPDILSKLTVVQLTTEALAEVDDNLPTEISTPKTTTSISTTTIVQTTPDATGAVCDTRRAATNTITGLIIACGQSDEIWVPIRCPRNTFCMKSLNSIFRVCCPAEFGA